MQNLVVSEICVSTKCFFFNGANHIHSEEHSVHFCPFAGCDIMDITGVTENLPLSANIAIIHFCYARYSKDVDIQKMFQAT